VKFRCGRRCEKSHHCRGRDHIGAVLIICQWRKSRLAVFFKRRSSDLKIVADAQVRSLWQPVIQRQSLRPS
jgi:hypothetical protein